MDLTVKRLEDFESNHDFFFRARSGLGVTSFGMSVEKHPPNSAWHPEHDHADDGQEEVYVPLEGSGTLYVGGGEVALERGVFVRVGPRERRRIVAGGDGLLVLCLGGVPGRAYEPPAFSEEGAPWTE